MDKTPVHSDDSPKAGRIPLLVSGSTRYWAEVMRDPASGEQVAVVYRSGPTEGRKCEFFSRRFPPKASEETLRKELSKRLSDLRLPAAPAYPELRLESIHHLLFLLRQFCQAVRSPGLGFAPQHVMISFEDQHCLICDGRGEPQRATHSEGGPDGCVDECSCKDGYEVLDPNRVVALHFYASESDAPGSATPRASYPLGEFLDRCRCLEPIPLP